ncbi:MAG: LuxR family transcriptional regulator [Pseudomonadota bacterium]
MSETTLDDLIASVDLATDGDDLWARAVMLMRAEGVVTACYHHYPRPSSLADPILFHDGWPTDLIRRYRDEGFWRMDPTHRLARRSILAVSWADVRARAEMTVDQAALMTEIEALGPVAGTAFQLPGPHLRSGAMSLGFSVPLEDLPARTMSRLLVIAQTFHIRLCALTPDLHGPAPQLSPREYEIVDQIVGGASNKAIARALSVSPHTIDTLVRRLFGKLGVSDRTSAAISAIGSGLVLPQDISARAKVPSTDGSA